MAIKMKINKDKESYCDECGTIYKNTLEMYDLMLCNEIYTLCYDCVGELFHKTLKCSCMYDSKVKRTEDQVRMQNYKKK